jgi:hypothetical protein
MSIHTMDMDWPEPAEEPSKWNYTIGSRVLFVKEISEAFTPTIRFA